MRTAWVMRVLWAASLVLLALWLGSAVLRRAPSKEAAGYFPRDFLDRARRRAMLGYLSSGLGTLLTFGVLYLVGRRSAAGPLLSSFLRKGQTLHPALLGLALGAAAVLLVSVVNLPVGVYGLYLDRSYGLSRMSLAAWLGDYAKGTFLSLLEYSFAGSFAAWAIARFPRTWHLLLAGAFVIAAFLISAIFPVLIAPMFNRFRPLPEGPTLTDVRELAGEAGMRVDKVLVMEASVKTTRANAYFAGVGSTKEVVLYDTLLGSHSPEQVRLVIAHELGHWRYGHLVKGILASAAGVLSMLLLFRATIWRAWVSGSPGPAGTVMSLLALERLLVALFVFATLAGYVLTPAASYISRRFEAQSDAYSLALTSDRPAFVSTHVNLAQRNLGDVEPPPFIRWFAWTHPSTLERIRSASAF